MVRRKDGQFEMKPKKCEMGDLVQKLVICAISLLRFFTRDLNVFGCVFLFFKENVHLLFLHENYFLKENNP